MSAAASSLHGRINGLVGTHEWSAAFYKERRTILGSFVKEGHG